MPFINIPSSGSASWKDAVADPASLPASGNEVGDARVTESTSEIYVWDGSAWQSTGSAGMTNPMTTQGDLITGGAAGAPQRLGLGTEEYVLAAGATDPYWTIEGVKTGYPTDTVVLGRTKPAGLTGATNLLVGTGAGNALQTNTDCMAIGKDSLLSMLGAGGNFYLAIGNEALRTASTISDLTATGAIAIGYQASRNATDIRKSCVIGHQAALAGGERNTVIGWKAKNTGAAAYCVVIGDGAGNPAGNESVVIGSNCQGSGTNLVAVGSSIVASSFTNSVAIGRNAVLNGNNSIAIGNASRADNANEFAVGSSTSQINTMIIGRGGASQTVANAVKIQTMRGSGTDRDMSVGTLTIAGAQGTGTGPGGDVIIATAPAGASGSTLNNHVDRFKVTAAGETQFLGSTSGYVGVSSPAAPTSYSLVLPSAQGGAGTTLENDGSGNLSWVSGGLPSLGGNEDKVLATDGLTTSWQYAGLGSGSFASGTVILGRPKPTSLTGADNIIIGSSAGNSLSNQTKHIAIGTSALSTFNVAVANEPNQCVAIGYEALKAINIASQNWGMVAIGYRAGYNATLADGSVLIGFSAGNNGTSFGRCVYIGRQAGGGGSVNTGVGMASLRACTGSENTALGDSSLSNLSIGTHNIGIGVNAGNSPTGGVTITTGSSNIIIGHQAGVLTASTSSAIALGRLSVAGTNEFSIGSDSYQINTMLLGRGGASQTVANAVKIQTMRGSGTDTDMSVGTLTIAGAQGTGTGAGGDVIIATAPPDVASGSSLNAHFEVMRITDDGLVGIQTSTPSDPLTVQGAINYTDGSSDYKISPAHHDEGTETGNFTINWSNAPVHTVTLNGTTNAVVTMNSPLQGGAYVLRIIQGATPGTIDFTAGSFADAVWPGGTPPTLSGTTGDVDIINLLYIDDGGGTVTYYGTFATDFS